MKLQIMFVIYSLSAIGSTWSIVQMIKQNRWPSPAVEASALGLLSGIVGAWVIARQW